MNLAIERTELSELRVYYPIDFYIRRFLMYLEKSASSGHWKEYMFTALLFHFSDALLDAVSEYN